MTQTPSQGQNITLEPDEPPRDGVWVDTCDILTEPTDDELYDGLQLGMTIDPEDDDDAGPQPLMLIGSDREAALTKARRLKRVMLDYGVPQVSIELLPGRPNSYGVYDALYVVDEFSHHTVSRLGVNKTPVLSLCKYGRSDLPGPLCNGYGGWDLTYRILTFGYANHPGEGGPLTVPAYSGGTYTIPKDSARRYAWGTEWEGGLSEADWDTMLTNPRNGKRMTMREFMGRSNAALREYHKIAHHSEHSTWTTRKIDRLNYTSASGTRELLRYQKEDDDMPNYSEWSEADKAALANDVADAVLGRKVGVRSKDGRQRITVKQAIGRSASTPMVVGNQTEKVLGKIDEVLTELDGDNA